MATHSAPLDVLLNSEVRELEEVVMIRAMVAKGDKQVLAWAVDFGANMLPVYMEDPPRDQHGNVLPDWFPLDHLLCPDCNKSVLLRGGAVGSNGAVGLRCRYQGCQVRWKHSDDMPSGVILETL